MRKLFYISVCLFLLCLAACRKSPDHVIAPHEMASLLADLHRGEGAVDMNYRTFGSDSMKLALREAIYKKHNVTKEMVDTSFDWYGHHIDEYMKVYTEVIDLLQREIDQTDASAARIQMAAVGDSVDTWNFSPRYILNSNSILPNLSVYLTPDENWEKGDNYTVNFKIINSVSPLSSVLGVEYDDGQLEWIDNKVNESGKFTYTLITDSTKTIRKVFATVSASPTSNETVFVDSLSLMRTRVNRQNYMRRMSQKKLQPLIRKQSPATQPRTPDDSVADKTPNVTNP